MSWFYYILSLIAYPYFISGEFTYMRLRKGRRRERREKEEEYNNCNDDEED